MPFWRHACFMQIKGVWGALKMREWKMQEWKMRERQSMESHKKKYSKAPDEIWLSWLSCLVLAKRNSQASRRVNVATNHRQCVRCQRVTRDLAIRRAKKRVNLTNDKHIKLCLQRFDSHAYTRLQFLRAVSDTVGSEKMLSEKWEPFRHGWWWRHEAPGWQYTASEWWQQWRRRYANDRISWRSCWLLRGVSRGTAWYTHRAGAVRSSTLLWVVCQRSAQRRTRLSSLPHAYQHVAAFVLTWLARELGVWK